MKVCKGTGNFSRTEMTVYVCNDCGYFAKSSGGLTQHKNRGTNCKNRTMSRTMSRLELSVTNVSSTKLTTLTRLITQMLQPN